MLKVDTACMEAQIAQLNEIAKRLDGIANRVSSVNRKLGWNSGVDATIRLRLSGYGRGVATLNNKAVILSDVLNHVMEQYIQAEGKATDPLGDPSASESSKGSGFDWSNISVIDWIKSVLEVLDKTDKDKNGIGGIAGKLTGYLESLYKLFTGESDFLSGAEGWLNLFDNSVDLWAEFYDTLRYYYDGEGSAFSAENQARVEGLGLIGSIMGFASAIFGAADTISETDGIGIAGRIGQAFETGDEAADVVKEVIDLLSTGNDVPDGAYTPADLYATIVESYTAAFGQGFTSYEQYAADGTWTLGDTAATGVESSVAGLYSMIDALTFGLVSEKTTGVSDADVSNFLEKVAGDIGTKAGNYIKADDQLCEQYQNANPIGRALITIYAAFRS